MLNGRALNERDKARIAATRARSGMDLDEQSQPQPASLAGAMNAAPMPPAQAASLQNAMNAPPVPRLPEPSLAAVMRGPATHRAPDRSLVIAKAQQKSAERRLRMSGMSPLQAAVFASPDSDARNLAMGGRQFAGQIAGINAQQQASRAENQGMQGLRDAQAGLAQAQADDLARRGKMLEDPATRQQARIDQALQSDNPQLQAWAMSQMTQGTTGQPGGVSLTNAWNLPPVTRDDAGDIPEADIKRILDRLPDKIDNPTAALQQMQQLGVDKADLEQHFDENREPSLMDVFLDKLPQWATNVPTHAIASNPLLWTNLPVAAGLGRMLRTSKAQAKRRSKTQKANTQKLGSLGIQ